MPAGYWEGVEIDNTLARDEGSGMIWGVQEHHPEAGQVLSLAATRWEAAVHASMS